jgi:hypothetical protein
MTKEEFEMLHPGDIIEGKSSRTIFIVTGNFGNRVTAVQTVDVTNPDEWKLVMTAEHKCVIGKNENG